MWRHRLDYSFEDLGEQQVKNIARPDQDLAAQRRRPVERQHPVPAEALSPSWNTQGQGGDCETYRFRRGWRPRRDDGAAGRSAAAAAQGSVPGYRAGDRDDGHRHPVALALAGLGGGAAFRHTLLDLACVAASSSSRPCHSAENGGQLALKGPKVRRLAAGGRWIRTFSTAARKPAISEASRHDCGADS